MKKYPISTSVGSTCIKTFSADLLVQYAVEKKRSLNEIDWTRTAVFATFGFTYLGILQYWLYNSMYFKLFPGITIKSTIKKVLFDQFIKAPILYWPIFYTLQILLNEKSINCNLYSKLKIKWETNIIDDLKRLWLVWIPGQAITFGIMPLHLRLPWIAFLSFFWCCYISFFRGHYQIENENENKNENVAETEIASDIIIANGIINNFTEIDRNFIEKTEQTEKKGIRKAELIEKIKKIKRMYEEKKELDSIKNNGYPIEFTISNKLQNLKNINNINIVHDINIDNQS